MKGKKIAVVLTMVVSLMISCTVMAQIRPIFYNRVETNSMTAVKRGEKAMKAGDMRKAERYFKKAIKLMKKNYEAYGYMGILETQKGNLAAAQKQFRESIKMFEPYKKLMMTRITDYIRHMETTVTNSRLAVDQALKPMSGGADVVATNRDNKKVIEDYNKEYDTLKNMKYPAFFQFKYGNLMLAAGYPKAAKVHYLAAVDADPTFKDTYGNLAVCWFMEGNCAEAVKAYKKAKELKGPINPKFEADLKKKCGVQ